MWQTEVYETAQARVSVQQLAEMCKQTIKKFTYDKARHSTSKGFE